MQPLKITFRMQTPICLTYPFIFFDALIAHLALREKLGENYRTLPSKRVIDFDFSKIVPIKQSGKIPIFHASVSIFDIENAYTTTIYKRFYEKHIYGKLRKKIRRGSGYFRDYMIKLVYIPARTTTFYVYGDKERIKKLLKGLSGLGKKTAIGFGAIKDFQIEETDKDYSLVKDGKAMRPIPIENVKYGKEVVLMSYKPPYWAKQNIRPCVPPFTEVEL